MGDPPMLVALGIGGIGDPPMPVAFGIGGMGDPPILVALGIGGMGDPPIDVEAHEVFESPVTDAKLLRSVTLANTTTRASKKARQYLFMRLSSSWEFEGLRQKANGAKV